MLSQPIFDDRSLSQSFYYNLIQRFPESLQQSIQNLLGECSLGIAPSPTGVKTFFIIAPSLLAGDQLIDSIDIIIQRVAALMGGVGQVAICIKPPQDITEQAAQEKKCHFSSPTHPQYMMCKIFSVCTKENDQKSRH